MSQTFYVAVNGQQTGPFSFDELKDKAILRETLVWTEGFDNWTKAGDIPLLREIIKVTPPPLPNQEKKVEVAPPPIVTPEPIGKYFGYELAGRRDRFFAALMQALVLLIPYLIIFGANSDPDVTYSAGRIIGGTVFSAILGAFFYSIWSGNLGHKIMGLKVISSVDGTDKQNALAGALRESVKHVTSLLILPVIWLLWDDDRQNLYDKLVKTYVVKKKPIR